MKKAISYCASQCFSCRWSRQITDFLHMLKLGGEWKIVNIIDF